MGLTHSIGCGIPNGHTAQLSLDLVDKTLVMSQHRHIAPIQTQHVLLNALLDHQISHYSPLMVDLRRGGGFKVALICYLFATYYVYLLHIWQENMNK